jgi:hypothetical protein
LRGINRGNQTTAVPQWKDTKAKERKTTTVLPTAGIMVVLQFQVGLSQ